MLSKPSGGVDVAEGSVLFIVVPGAGVAAGSQSAGSGGGGAGEPAGGLPGVREQLGVRARAFAVGGLLQSGVPDGGLAASAVLRCEGLRGGVSRVWFLCLWCAPGRGRRSA